MTTNSYQTPDITRDWLLDPNDPGARYLALLKLSDAPESVLQSAGKKAHQDGPIKTVLDHLHPDGYWDNDGPGYLPKYISTAWSLILLSQLGASVEFDKRIAPACQRYLDLALSINGQISSNGRPSGTVDCLQGNILSAFLDLGYKDERLKIAFDWMARSTTGIGISPMGDKKASLRYYSGKIGPDFQCGANNKLSCAWGASKVMLAFSKLPENKRTDLINQAICKGVEFLFSTDPATADYPNGWNPKPSGNWWKFGFPVFYVTDLLQICESLVRLGYLVDPRLNNAIQLILDKQDSNGTWPLEYSYGDKTWVDFGAKNVPNKWVTIRALEVLKHFGSAPLISY